MTSREAWINNLKAENVANRIWKSFLARRMEWQGRTTLPASLIAKFIRPVDSPLPPIVSEEILEFLTLADFLVLTQGAEP